MNIRDITDAILNAEYAYEGSRRIKIETLITALIAFVVTFSNTENFKTGLIAGISLYIIISILWRIPYINKFMIYFFSFIWGVICIGLFLWLNTILAVVIGIIAFLSSISLHKSWIE